MDLLKDYIDSNKKFLMIYIGICLSFYFINYIFYRDSIDAPVDLIFTVVYIFVASGTVMLFTLSKSNFLTVNSRIFLIIINMIVPFLISFLFAIIYWIIEMQDSVTISQFLLLQVVSFPLMLVSVILILLFKCYKMRKGKIMLIGIIIFVVYYCSLYGLGVIETQTENSIVTSIGYIVLFLIFPFGYMAYLIAGLGKELFYKQYKKS